ncbi:hypothetical protein [Salisediminibacterium halotolerans]|uniref:hypothetical protein n=1 Tax=Salisediminibacterium halotolerans TaxID=517425 RepID=UPI000EB19B94|nr:hypothetical protein [Salisediminibacterium halotolerans]RLJ78268.1 hypothetical protein BCL39_0739 [Actinophytocola xinjiangensis]RPE88393.1 hypothetical protein EDD67_0720 [Salisediminibacterium halotolerans]TWG37245.1 hypothetical protein BCL52_0738 [Salisediminibacterium halotolerans]GEL07725.1 hypothetical protein SHA02_11410 [Salisediminibacterium halotolerans]
METTRNLAADTAKTLVRRLEQTVKERDHLPAYSAAEEELLDTVIPDESELDQYEVKLRQTQIFLAGVLMMALPAFFYIWLVQQFAESMMVLAGLAVAGVTIIIFAMYYQTQKVLDKLLEKTRKRQFEKFWSDVQKNAGEQADKTAALLQRINAETSEPPAGKTALNVLTIKQLAPAADGSGMYEAESVPADGTPAVWLVPSSFAAVLTDKMAKGETIQLSGELSQLRALSPGQLGPVKATVYTVNEQGGRKPLDKRVLLDLYYRIGFAYSLEDSDAEAVLLGDK